MEFKDFDTSVDFANRMDHNDPLHSYREHFFIPENTVYLDGNSLGLCAKQGETALLRVLDEWKTMGIGGWLDGEKPWFYLAEEIGALMAPVVGALPEEVICTGTTTVNQHALLSTFYQPSGKRTKIVADEKNFPSDIYALKSHLKLRGYDPEEHLVLIPADPDGYIQESTIFDNLSDDVALVLLPAVFFRTGQLLDLPSITRMAHEKDIIAGFDCSHSAGIVPHNLSDAGVDFAFWCGYKYLNGGPGCPAFIYLNKRHFSKEPMMAGWFGYQKEKQFEMSLDFHHQESAGGWQISTPAILGMAPLEKSLEMINDAGIDQIREKSLSLSSYFMNLVDALLLQEPYGFYSGTPGNADQRGGHVALRRSKDARLICEALKNRGFVPDFRNPDIIRVAPSPLYSRFTDIWNLVAALLEIIESGEHQALPSIKKPIS